MSEKLKLRTLTNTSSMSCQEAADILHVTDRAIRLRREALEHDGVKFIRFGKCWRIDAESFIRWFDGGGESGGEGGIGL